MKYELPSTELIVIEENNYLKFGEYLNDMQCDDTVNKLSLDDLEYVKKLQQENQQLREKIRTYEDPNDLTLMFMYCDEKAKDKIKELKKQLNGINEERTYLYNKLSVENEQLNSLVNSCQEEIRRLKKQLEEYIKQNMKLKDELFDKRKEYQDTYKDVRIEIKEYKSQQKEFISYLENEIYSIEPKGTCINYNCEYDSEEDYVSAMKECSKLNTLKEILHKYKEIIGDDK